MDLNLFIIKLLINLYSFNSLKIFKSFYYLSSVSDFNTEIYTHSVIKNELKEIKSILFFF